jgi:hypothetical protein
VTGRLVRLRTACLPMLWWGRRQVIPKDAIGRVEAVSTSRPGELIVSFDQHRGWLRLPEHAFWGVG